MTFKQHYEAIVHDYCNEFYNRIPEVDTGYCIENWVGNEVGGVLMDGDYFFDFSDIKTCVDYHIPWEALLNWYDDNLERPEWPNLLTYWKLVRDHEDREKAHEEVKKMFPLTTKQQEDYQYRRAVEDMIQLADEIELRRTSIGDRDEWYGFKEFRNVMRDRLEEMKRIK